MAYFARRVEEQDRQTLKSRRGKLPQRDTSLWDKDGGVQALRPPPSRSAAQKTSLWGSESAQEVPSASKSHSKSSSEAASLRTSLWGSDFDGEVTRRTKPAVQRAPPPFASENQSMFSGSQPAETTYQGDRGQGSLFGELALDLESRFRTAHEAFLAADLDKSGSLTIEELISLCRAHQLPPDNVKIAMSNVDRDHNGKIDYTEFARHLMRTATPGAIQPSSVQAPPEPVQKPSADEIKKRIIQDLVASGASEEQIFAELARFDESRGVNSVGGEVTRKRVQAPVQTRAPAEKSAKKGHAYLNASAGVSSIFGGYEADAQARQAAQIQPKALQNSSPSGSFQPMPRRRVNPNMRPTSLW